MVCSLHEGVNQNIPENLTRFQQKYDRNNAIARTNWFLVNYYQRVNFLFCIKSIISCFSVDFSFLQQMTETRKKPLSPSLPLSTPTTNPWDLDLRKYTSHHQRPYTLSLETEEIMWGLNLHLTWPTLVTTLPWPGSTWHHHEDPLSLTHTP